MSSVNGRQRSCAGVSQQPPALCTNPARWAQRNCSCDALDAALVLLLQREEDLLRDVVEQCHELVLDAEQQALELEEYLEDQA